MKSKSCFLLRVGLILLVTFVFGISSEANNSERSRVLVHTLNYLSHDYKNAVVNGKLKSESEYEEMREFSKAAVGHSNEFGKEWSKDDSTIICSLVFRLDSLVQNQASFEVVSPLANEAKLLVIKASGLVVVPLKYPSVSNGKAIFAANCAKCHGDKGYGDGKEGLALNPPPRNFNDNDRMAGISAFGAFNTVRCGIAGTGMKPHPQLSDEEVWDVAFYVLSIRYQKKLSDKNFEAEKVVTAKLPSLNMNAIAAITDEELQQKFHADENTLAAVRLQEPGENKDQFIRLALQYIDEASLASRDGNYEEAQKLAALSYLEGIEPIEKQLRSSDPALMERLEEQMANVRKMINEHRSKTEVSDSLKVSRALITEVGKVLEGREVSFWLAMLMAVSILLREGLEAFLVIMVILSVIKAAELKGAKKFVHVGWILAVGLGVLLWMLGGQLIKMQRARIELIEGVISFVAVAMLLYIGFWLHGKSEAGKWKDYVTSKVKSVMNSDSLLGLLALSFFVVFREVFESVLFLSALNIESAGKQENAIVFGVILAFVLVIVLAWIVLKFSAKLPIPKLFKISSFVMAVLAIVLVGKGTHSLQETGLVSIHQFPITRIELLGIFPTLETVLAQVLVFLLVRLVWKLSNAKTNTAK